jgi:signal transduction histidine kinase
VLSERFTPRDGRDPLLLRVAAPLGAAGKLVARLRQGLLLALALAALLSAGGAALLAHWLLAPLHRLSADVDRLEARSLAGRLETAGLDPALARLAVAFNGLLSRVAAVVEGQQAFIGRASHALRTPLASILTEAEVALRRERTAEGYRQSLEAIAASTRGAARLTDGLLALNRAEADRAPAAREEVPLDTFAQQLLRRFAARAEAAGLSLEASAPAGLTLRCAPERLGEAVDALVDNALRYTPRGGSVGFEAREHGAGARLLVRDTGPGFAPADRAHVFERFFRGSAAAASGQPGSGLGLSLAKALVEAEGGALCLEESPGGGAALALSFPSR